MLKVRSLGIKCILSSTIKGEGGTKAQMSKVQHTFHFLGISASKWVKETSEFEQLIRRICSLSNGCIKLILLDPSTDNSEAMSYARVKDGITYKKNDVRVETQNALDQLKNMLRQMKSDNESKYASALDRIQVRLYKQMPVVRLVLIDNNKAYLSFYRSGSDGNKTKQLVVYPSKIPSIDEQNILNPLIAYFDNMWTDDNITTPYDLSV